MPISPRVNARPNNLFSIAVACIVLRIDIVTDLTVMGVTVTNESRDAALTPRHHGVLHTETQTRA
jgi:hypothetical protein